MIRLHSAQWFLQQLLERARSPCVCRGDRSASIAAQPLVCREAFISVHTTPYSPSILLLCCSFCVFAKSDLSML